MSILKRVAGRLARLLAPSLVVSRVLAGQHPYFTRFFARVPHAVVPALSTGIHKLSMHGSAKAQDELVAFAPHMGIDGCLTLSGEALAAGSTGLGRRLYDAGVALPGSESSVRAKWLAFWFSRSPGTRSESAGTPAGTRVVPKLAVIDYRHPDLLRASINIGDWVQTIAVLGNIVRHTAVTLAGEPSLVKFAENLRSRVVAEDSISSQGSLELSVVQRDVSDLDDIAPDTWLIAYGWYMWPRYGDHFNFPFHENVLPIFLSFHCNAPQLLTPESVEYLRSHGPVGCRDWSTVDLLLSKGIPAFFSGCVTSTLSHVARRTLTDSAARSLPKAFVDLEVSGDAAGTVSRTQADADVLQRDVSSNLDVALDLLDDYRDSYQSVTTSRLHCYLPCRAMGTPSKITPPDAADIRFAGLLGIDDHAFENMADGISAKIAKVLGWVLAGESPESVYARWGSLCEPDVAVAKSRNAAGASASSVTT